MEIQLTHFTKISLRPTIFAKFTHLFIFITNHPFQLSENSN